MKKIIYLSLLLSISLASCNNDTKQSESKNITRSEMSSMNKTSIDKIIDGYIDIKNALVNDNKQDASKGGKALLSSINNYDMTKLTEEQHVQYMEIIENAKEQTEHIIKSPIDHQREHFEVLSTDIIDLITLLGTDESFYQVFCPMANGGKGAIWLSEIEDIKNPYFGSKMLKCGKVQKQIN